MHVDELNYLSDAVISIQLRKQPITTSTPSPSLPLPPLPPPPPPIPPQLQTAAAVPMSEFQKRQSFNAATNDDGEEATNIISTKPINISNNNNTANNDNNNNNIIINNNNNNNNNGTSMAQQDNQNAVVMSTEEALVFLTNKTKFPIIQENGQRRYGPPPSWKGDSPPRGCEVFVGKIPRDCFEDELVPIFESIGPIYMFRLMMDFSGSNRGYGFCIYTNREHTKLAVQKLDNFEIRTGKVLGVCYSVDNCRLFVGGIPKAKNKDEIFHEMVKVTDGVKDVIVYPSAADKTKNRGFAFVEYDNHKAAAMARRKLIPGRIQLWGHPIAVDWAEPEREVDETIMSKVKVLYVRNLMLSTTEDTLRDIFNEKAGSADAVERVKKMRDYAFVHFKERDQAEIALMKTNDMVIESSRIEVTWAKPADKSENNLRYTRNSMRNATPPQLPAPAAYSFLLDPFLCAQLYSGAAVNSNSAFSIFENYKVLSQEDTDEMELNFSSKTSRNGRVYRNAAGSRSASARPNSILGNCQRDKTNCIEILEDVSQKNHWGTPLYTTQQQTIVDCVSGVHAVWHYAQVVLPELGRSFLSPNLYRSVEEAKQGVAEYAMQLLQMQLQQIEGSQCQQRLAVASVFPTGACGSMPEQQPAYIQIAPGSYSMMNSNVNALVQGQNYSVYNLAPNAPPLLQPSSAVYLSSQSMQSIPAYPYTVPPNSTNPALFGSCQASALTLSATNPGSDPLCYDVLAANQTYMNGNMPSKTGVPEVYGLS